ncbi:MAG: glycosyltransferase family 39 protein, partial [Chloroflexi bacterium]|nr:glycosyltransferase family 39 protein [Chloroflexota bacterium]
MTSKLPAAGLLLALALYLALSLYQLDLPGLHNDEAQEAGLQAMQLATGRPVTAFRGAGLNLAGRTLPLMVQDYIGALNVALALPFVRMLGATVAALRLPAVLLGALTLALLYRLVGRLASPGSGALAALLLAVQPSFVFWMRQGAYVTNVTLPVGLALLLAAAAWARRGGRGLALAMGLLAGLGLYAKLLFVWLLGGALAAALLLSLSQATAGGWPPAVGRRRAEGSTPRHRVGLWPRTPTPGELAAAALGAL